MLPMDVDGGKSPNGEGGPGIKEDTVISKRDFCLALNTDNQILLLF